MKRIFTFTLALLLVFSALPLVGCGSSFDFERDLDRLLDNGYRISWDRVGNRALTDLSHEYANDLKSVGKEMSVWVERQVDLEYEHNVFYFCTMIKFSSNEQAQAYAACFAFKRSDNREKVAYHKNVVVITNADDVQRNLDLEFK